MTAPIWPDDDARYTLAESFDIDDGSLADMTPEHAFVLGVEWESVWRRISNRDIAGFDYMVHRANVSRLEALAVRRGWIATTTQSVDPAWALIRFIQARPVEPRP